MFTVPFFLHGVYRIEYAVRSKIGKDRL